MACKGRERSAKAIQGHFATLPHTGPTSPVDPCCLDDFDFFDAFCGALDPLHSSARGLHDSLASDFVSHGVDARFKGLSLAESSLAASVCPENSTQQAPQDHQQHFPGGLPRLPFTVIQEKAGKQHGSSADSLSCRAIKAHKGNEREIAEEARFNSMLVQQQQENTSKRKRQRDEDLEWQPTKRLRCPAPQLITARPSRESRLWQQPPIHQDFLERAMLLDATATPFPRQTWLEGNVARKQPLFISTPDYKSLDASRSDACARGSPGLQAFASEHSYAVVPPVQPAIKISGSCRISGGANRIQIRRM